MGSWILSLMCLVSGGFTHIAVPPGLYGCLSCTEYETTYVVAWGVVVVCFVGFYGQGGVSCLC